MSPSFSDMHCSVAQTLAVVGERWALLILRDAMYGVRRFEEFQQSLGIARNILADRLDKLSAHGVLERRPYQERPTRHEYALTAKGKDLFPVLMTMMAWGDKWAGTDETPRIATHRDCGQSGIYAAAVCSHCGEELTLRNTIVDPIPDVVLARLARA